jgi:hypothetical protein
MSSPSQDSTARSERVSAAFAKLKVSAKSINEISGKLGKQIQAVEECLQRINVGVACWAKINEGRDGDEYWSQSIGYCSFKDDWHIAIETREGADWADEDKVERWPFDKAPRYLQPKAVDKLPELIEALVSATDAAAARIQEKIGPAEEIASSIYAVLYPKKK